MDDKKAEEVIREAWKAKMSYNLAQMLIDKMRHDRKMSLRMYNKLSAINYQTRMFRQ